MKKICFVLMLFWKTPVVLAVCFLALPPAPQFLALPPAPLQNSQAQSSDNPFFHFFNKSKNAFRVVLSFLSAEDQNSLYLSHRHFAKEISLRISDHELRAERICDMLLSKFMPPCLHGFFVNQTTEKLYLIKEKILNILEKNKKIICNIKINTETSDFIMNKESDFPFYFIYLNLNHFTNLEKLEIGGFCIRLCLLENLPNLKSLSLENALIKSLIFKNLSLTELNLNGVCFDEKENPFKNFPPTLKKLSLQNARIRGKDLNSTCLLEHVPRFQNLEYLCIDSNGHKAELETIFKDLSFLKQLYINFQFKSYKESVKNLEFLINLKNLTHLSLPKTCFLKDFSGIFGLSRLEYLDLSEIFFYNFPSWFRENIQNSSLKELEKLTELRYLGLSGTSIQDFSCIKSLKKLEHLNLSFSMIANLKGIKNLENLRILHLGDRVDIIDDLVEMTDAQLQKLSVFLVDEETIPKKTEKTIDFLNKKGVRFLRPETNLQEMISAYKESPFLDPSYKHLIEDEVNRKSEHYGLQN